MDMNSELKRDWKPRAIKCKWQFKKNKLKKEITVDLQNPCHKSKGHNW